MKSGTSSLFRYLCTHPDLVSFSIKETDFFTKDANFSKAISYYEDLFIGKGNYAFEASPNYTKYHKFPGVPKRIHSVLPNIKLIYVLRNPIESIISHYIHNYSVGRENFKFSEAIKENDNYILTSKYYFQIQAYLDFFQLIIFFYGLMPIV